MLTLLKSLDTKPVITVIVQLLMFLIVPTCLLHSNRLPTIRCCLSMDGASALIFVVDLCAQLSKAPSIAVYVLSIMI